MSTVAVNPGVAALLQILSNAGAPSLSSALSTTSIQSALQAASPADIAQLSDQAVQLQVANSLFANTSPSQTVFSASSLSNSNVALENLLTNLYSPTPTTPPSSTASAASQIATYQSQLQNEQLQALFGVDPNVGASGTLLNVVA
jgi:hypothetical protein